MKFTLSLIVVVCALSHCIKEVPAQAFDPHPCTLESPCFLAEFHPNYTATLEGYRLRAILVTQQRETSIKWASYNGKKVISIRLNNALDRTYGQDNQSVEIRVDFIPSRRDLLPKSLKLIYHLKQGQYEYHQQVDESRVLLKRTMQKSGIEESTL